MKLRERLNSDLLFLKLLLECINLKDIEIMMLQFKDHPPSKAAHTKSTKSSVSSFSDD